MASYRSYMAPAAVSPSPPLETLLSASPNDLTTLQTAHAPPLTASTCSFRNQRRSGAVSVLLMFIAPWVATRLCRAGGVVGSWYCATLRGLLRRFFMGTLTGHFFSTQLKVQDYSPL